MKKVLVLCHGNINRSPLCAALLAQRTGVEILQAALKPITRPERAAKKMREAAAGIGLDLEEHRSQQVTRAMVDEADMVIYMDGGNLKRLKVLMRARYPDISWRCLGEFATKPVTRIPDPAFQKRDSTVFRDTIALIQDASHNLAKVIAKASNESQDEGKEE